MFIYDCKAEFQAPVPIVSQTIECGLSAISSIGWAQTQGLEVMIFEYFSPRVAIYVR